MKLTNAKELRSDCPTNYFAEIIGDKWSLLVVRDIIFWGKLQHNEFRASDEHIATNILATRLTALTENDILTKTANQDDRRRDNYALTKKGLGLIPLLLDITLWSDAYGPEQLFTSKNLLAELQSNREALIKEITEMVENGSYVFTRHEWQPHKKRRL